MTDYWRRTTVLWKKILYKHPQRRYERLSLRNGVFPTVLVLCGLELI